MYVSAKGLLPAHSLADQVQDLGLDLHGQGLPPFGDFDQVLRKWRQLGGWGF
jgi:hypothetical protein